jgi:hypothetical protein
MVIVTLQPPYPSCSSLGMRLRGHQNPYRRRKVEEILFPLTKIGPRFLGRTARSTIATPTAIFRLPTLKSSLCDNSSVRHNGQYIAVLKEGDNRFIITWLSILRYEPQAMINTSLH